VIVLYGIVVILVCMPGWKEKASKVVQRIRKNRLVQWFYDKDISTQYRILFVILASVIVIWNIVNIYFNSFKIDDVSARYLLSALVQSLAAIIAIVVTLTLVAVQLTASAYSPRVIDVFKENNIMWWLLVWYGLSIFSGLFVLELIGGTYSNFWCIIVPIEILVLLVYLMGIAAFAGLFWHIGNVIDLLKPENIIERLADKITKDRILNLKEDPIQPMMDIIHGSVMKYDIATTRVGLKTVTDQVIEIIDLGSQEEISKSFCSHFNLVGTSTVRNTDEESTVEVIQNLGCFGKSAAESGFKDAAVQAAYSLRHIGKATAEHGLKNAAKQAAKSLESVGTTAAEKRYEVVTEQTIQSLGHIGKAAATKRIKRASNQVVQSLRVIGKAAAEKGLEDATDQAAKSLGNVGKTAERNELERAVEQAGESLGQVGKIAAESGFRGAAAGAAMDLVFFGRFEIEKGNDATAERVIWFLKEIGNTGAEKGLKRVAWQAAKSLGLLGIDAAEKGKEFEEVTKKVIYHLNYIGASAEVPGLENATKQVAKSFICVGVFAVKNGLDGTAQEAAKSLAKLAMLHKEPVGQAIHESKSGLRAHDSFRKFMNLYKQQPEEL